jgi:2-dehydro-3-deoxyphosphogluconate aldolase/(4S)-4-hydroxy-2-oxoglutarate aldolase
MARFTRLEVLGAMLEERLVPVFYHPDPKLCRDVALACARGGSRLFELTHRGDGAHRVFEDLLDFLKREAPGVILGVGSIRDAHTAALYLSLGANFVVGPILDADTARVCNGRKVAYMPGCGSATEIAQAEALGCEIVKLFPGDCVGGPSFVKAVLGPSPWSLLMPTGGVEATRESVRAWIEAGAAAVGIGSSLIRKDLLEKGDLAGIEGNVRNVLGWIEECRPRSGKAR